MIQSLSNQPLERTRGFRLPLPIVRNRVARAKVSGSGRSLIGRSRTRQSALESTLASSVGERGTQKVGGIVNIMSPSRESHIELFHSPTLPFTKPLKTLVRYHLFSNRYIRHPHSTIPNQPSNVKMSSSTVNIAPVNTNAATEIKAPVDQVVGSTRCAKEGCNDWAEANSRFCTARMLKLSRERRLFRRMLIQWTQTRANSRAP